MSSKRITIFLAAFLSSLFLILSLFATPVTDDYCSAYGVTKFGILNSISYYNSFWTPSIYYFFTHTPWALPIASLTISSFITFTSVLLFLLFLYMSLRTLVENIPNEARALTKNSIIISVLASLGIVQSTVYFSSTSARNFDVTGIITDWFNSNLMSERDGQVLLWAAAIPLTSPKLFMSAGVVLLVLSLFSTKTETWRMKRFSLKLMALVVGLNTETLLIITFILLRSLLDFRDPKNRITSGILLISSVLGVSGSYLSSGAQNRTEALTPRGLTSYLSLFLGNLWQFIWMISLISMISLICVLFLRIKLDFDYRYPSNIKSNLRLLSISSVGSQLVIETLAYPAAYHWISLILVIAIWSFVELTSINFNNEKLVHWKKFITSFYIFVLIVTSSTFINTIFTAHEREIKWNDRSMKSLVTQKIQILDIPVLDNSSSVFAQDLIIDFPSIVPFSGLQGNFTKYCYQRLPLGF